VFKIFAKDGKERAPFLKADHIEDTKVWHIPVQTIKVQHYLEVEEDNFKTVRSSVRMVCHVLSVTSDLRQLDISLQYTEGESLNHVLESFTLL
jgi:hypothetical protein